MKKLNCLFIAFLLLSAEIAFSQDRIYLRKDTIDAKIQEIGLKRLKFQEKDLPIKEIRTLDILKIEYENGVVEDYGSTNPRKIRPLSLGILVSNFIFEEDFIAEIEMNYFIKPNFTLSVDVGPDIFGNIYLSAGPRYYFNKLHSTRKLVPYVGCQAGVVYTGGYSNEDQLFIQLPFGIDYLTKRGYNFAIEIKPMAISKYAYSSDLIGIKVGKNF